MLIDIHVHVQENRHPKLTRPNGSHYPAPERLVEMMDADGIDMAVILCNASPECRYTIVTPEEVLRISSEFPERFIPFCNVDPRYLKNSPESDFRPVLEAYKQLGCKGVGEYVPNIPFDDPLNMNLFKHVEEIGLPLTFHIAPASGGYYGCVDEKGLPRLEKVLDAFPDLVFLGHSQPFWAEISADVTGDNRSSYPKGPVKPGRVVELMRMYPNLHGDLSAGSGFNAISRDEEFGLKFMEEFSERLYFGTDIANDPQDLPAVGFFRKLKEEKLLPEEVYENITWRNASRLLGITENN